jgi:hypothetical protein
MSQRFRNLVIAGCCIFGMFYTALLQAFIEVDSFLMFVFVVFTLGLMGALWEILK